MIYESDSSKKTWEFYKSKYNSNDWAFWNEVDFDAIQTQSEKRKNYREFYKKDKRKYAWLKDGSTKIDELGKFFRFGGERVFNFGTQYYNFKKIIEDFSSDDNKKKVVLNLLEECKNSYPLDQNLSILPSVGGLNNVKGSIYFNENDEIRYSDEHLPGRQLDRFDSFIVIIDDYFKGENELVLSYTKGTPNEECLKNFLKEFENVYDFVYKLYLLQDEKFIDELIENGRKPIKSIDDVERYCLLAKKYWDRTRKLLK